MGFEDNKDALGFEDDQLDLDSDADLSMGNGTVKAQRKKGIKTEEVAFATTRRDRFGRRGDGEEMGEGADMLNPDKPTRIAGGFSRREMTPQEVKPLQSENSKFGYLFSEDEADEDEVSTVEGKAAAVDALAMKGDEFDAENVFERETRSVIHSQGKPQRRPEPEQSAQTAQPPQSAGSSRFSRRSEQKEQTESAEKPAASRFSRRAAVQESAPEPVREEPKAEAAPIPEEVIPPVKEEVRSEPAAEPAAEAVAEPAPENTVYADNQTYGNPYMYGQYPPPYSPYGGYPPQNPYGSPYGQPYGQPYGSPYGQPPYPYQYPANYAQPQYIPVGYVFQAGFVPVELAHSTPQRRRRPSAARTAHRYDQLPAAEAEEKPAREVHRIRAIAAKSEPVPEPVPELVPEQKPAEVPAAETASAAEEKNTVYESQYDRIAAEIPESPAHEEKAEEKPQDTAPSRFTRRDASQYTQPVQSEQRADESAAPSRFTRRDASQYTQPVQSEQRADESAVPSRFARRGVSSPANTQPEADINAAAPSASGGRFNKRG